VQSEPVAALRDDSSAAHGGYGEMVDDPQQVLPALSAAQRSKEEKRQAC